MARSQWSLFVVAGALLVPLASMAQDHDWVSVARDRAGRWAWQFDPSFEGARIRALNLCGSPACGTAFTVRAHCITYVESRAGGYWYGTGAGWSHQESDGQAYSRCANAAPPGTCRIVRSHCQGE